MTKNPVEIRLLFSLAVAGSVLAAGSRALAATGENYIGSERCRACHEFEYQVWERSAHARSQVSLSDEQRRDPKCNTCHTMAADTSSADTAIGCERCHGPGKYYHPRYVMRDRELARAVFLVEPRPEQCTQCHTEGTPSIRPFAYDEMWAKIDHGKAAREAWEKARADARAEARAAGADAKAAAAARPAPGKTRAAARSASKSSP